MRTALTTTVRVGIPGWEPTYYEGDPGVWLACPTGVFLVSEIDADRVLKYSWYVNRDGYLYRGGFGTSRSHTLAAFITMYYGMEYDIDHRNRTPLDNRRSNLRPLTYSLNRLNTYISDVGGIKVRSTSRGLRRYDARINWNYEDHHLGTFTTERRARIVRDYNVARMFAGKSSLIALKRLRHRHGPLGRVIINVYNPPIPSGLFQYHQGGQFDY